MVFVLVEWVRGKQLDIKIQNGINTVAILILASLSFYLIFGDIVRGVSPLQKIIEANPMLELGKPVK
jgi:hypothetical protein